MTRDAVTILLTRGLRGFADGMVSVLLAAHLVRLGFSSFEIGAIVTGTLVGSALLTVLVGLLGHRVDPRRVLLAAAGLMVATGVGFAWFQTFWPVFVVAVLGTLNPSAVDVSVFLPTEQAVLAHVTSGHERTALFARFNLSGGLTGGLGALASGVPGALAVMYGAPPLAATRGAFLFYATLGGLSAFAYRRLAPGLTTVATSGGRPLARSRPIVLRLAAFFSVDAFGGGFVVQSLLVLWLSQRFGLSIVVMAPIFFAAGLLGALSQLASPWLAARIGLVPTMVYTHLPANLFLVLAGIVPSAPAAVTFLLLRALFSQMDVPARQAYVMAAVPPEERAAAASVTNVPRSLASAVPPLLTGLMLQRSSFGWPLVCGGLLKAAYDLMLLREFRTTPGS